MFVNYPTKDNIGQRIRFAAGTGKCTLINGAEMVKFIIVRTRKIDEFKAKIEHSFHVPCLPEGRLFFNTTEP